MTLRLCHRRTELFVDIAKDKCVLDCGVVDHEFMHIKLPRGEWLHKQIGDVAELCVGVDIDVIGLSKMKRQGYRRLVCADVEELPFSERWDAVIAGEVIEHLNNAGRFIGSVKDTLRPGGLFALSTPHAHSLTRMYHALLGREVCHEEHTCYYTPRTLRRLLDNHGFEVISMAILPRDARYTVLSMCRVLIARVRPLYGDTIVCIARKPESVC